MKSSEDWQQKFSIIFFHLLFPKFYEDIAVCMATNDKGNNVAKSVSMTPDLEKEAEKRMAALGISNFSQYMRLLVQRDLSEGGDLVIRSGNKSSSSKRRK